MTANGLNNGIESPIWHLSLCLLLSWIILFLVQVKGVKVSGKVSYFTAIFPYMVLFTLLFKGCMLPGALEGIKYFIVPNFGRLTDIKVSNNNH